MTTDLLLDLLLIVSTVLLLDLADKAVKRGWPRPLAYLLAVTLMVIFPLLLRLLVAHLG